MDENRIWIIPFTGEKKTYVVGKIYGKSWNQGIRCPTNR